jgi:hypothetical protein
MKYMMLVYVTESDINEEQREQCYEESSALSRDLAAKGKFIASGPLQSVRTATSVRVRDGRRLITDGPFAETREQLGGYYLIDADDLDEAIDIAARIPPARFGTIEVRPVIELPGRHQV